MCRAEEPLAKHTPLRIGGPVPVWVEASDIDALKQFVRAAREAGVKWRIHWPFSDWLVRDGGLRGAILRLGEGFETITTTDEHVTMGASALWSALPKQIKGGLWDAMRTWPGTVGGLFEHGDPSQISRLCVGLSVCRSGRVMALDWPEDGPPKLSDATILLSLTLRRATASRRWLTGPKPPGVLFADEANTAIGKELERAGVLGTRLRSWRMSTEEPGRVVQLGGGSFNDLQMLIKSIRMRVEKSRGITLQPRIPVLGSEPGRRDR
jgi:UDP-N-acetylmuramate dehydrogenase